MRSKLQGAQFRWLNELLYTSGSQEALQLMQSDPTQFEAYHQGFRAQVAKWPVKPIDVFVHFLRNHPRLVVGDFGCGDAEIARRVPNKVHSFDLVATNERVTACDIAHVPLPEKSLDVVIFCLSLMGKNYMDFLREATRVLKPRGQLKICEVQSRFAVDGVGSFVAAVKALGYRLDKQDSLGKMFLLLDFQRDVSRMRTAEISEPVLKPCVYKKR